MTFLKGLSQHRIQARQAQQVDGAGNVEGGNKANKAQAPEFRGGQGAPAPKHKGKGLNGAFMRQTIGDVFDAGQQIGLDGALLSRHAASLEQLTGELSALSKVLDKATAKLPKAHAEDVRSIPARIVGSMSASLKTLDPNSAALSLSSVFKTLTKALGGKDLPTEAQQRGLLQVAHSVAELADSNMGGAFKVAAERMLASGLDGSSVRAVNDTISNSLAALKDSGAKNALFIVLSDALVDVVAADKAPAEAVKASAKRLNLQLTDAQVELLTQKATEGQQAKGKAAEVDQQQAQQVEAAKAEYKANLDGAHQEKLAPLADLRARVDTLNPAAQNLWFGQVKQYLAHDPKMLEAVAACHLGMLSSPTRELPNAQTLDQAAKQLVALSQKADKGITLDVVRDVARQHALHADPAKVVGTLTSLVSLVSKLEPDMVGKLVGVRHKDGGNGLTELANDFEVANRIERYKTNNGPMNSLVEAFKAADTKQAIYHLSSEGVGAAANIPDQENGPIVQLLRENLAGDLNAVVKAKQDIAVMKAAHSDLPGDSMARFVGIAAKHKLKLDNFLEDLTVFFKNCRGSKDAARDLRTLIAVADKAEFNPAKLVTAFNKSEMRAPVLVKTINSMLVDTNYQPTKEYLEEAVAGLGKGDDLLGQINAKASKAMMDQLGLGDMLEGGKVKVTESGLGEVNGTLKSFFSNGAGKAQINQDGLKGLMVAVLEDNFDSYRFTTAVADAHLKPLSDQATAAWMQPRVMTHIRFEGNGEAQFHERIGRASKIGGELLKRLGGVWGDLAKMEKLHNETVDKLRNTPKNQVAKRRELVAKIEGLPTKIDAMRWATQLAEMKPETITPQKFLALGEKVPSIRRMLGPAGDIATRELFWTMRLSDINYTEVTTDDGPSMSDIFTNATTACLSWPGYGGEVMAYGIDPNKRFMITRNSGGETRRAVLRIIERQDEGHVGEPLLLLERTYPDKVTEEEKQRLVEHTIRRAAEMGIGCAFATEYYWDASKTNRRAIIDMNKVIEDLCQRYDTKAEKKLIKAITRESNCNCEYPDSAPPTAGQRGQVTARHHKKKEDLQFENEFIIMTPK